MRSVGTVVRGIRTPIIKANDDLANIVVDSLLKAKENEGFEFRDRDIIAITDSEINDISEEAGIFKFNLKLQKEDDFDCIFSKLAAKGGVFREITPIKATLEDVFLKLTSNDEKKDI